MAYSTKSIWSVLKDTVVIRLLVITCCALIGASVTDTSRAATITYSNEAGISGIGCLIAIGGLGTQQTNCGEVFTAPGGTLQDWTFNLSTGTDPGNFKLVVAPWDGTRSVGPALYESAPRASLQNSTDLLPYSFSGLNLPLAAGQQYIAYLSTVGVATPLNIGFLGTSATNGVIGVGAYSTTNGFVDPLAVTTPWLQQTGALPHLSFSATFAATVPAPVAPVNVHFNWGVDAPFGIVPLNIAGNVIGYHVTSNVTPAASASLTTASYQAAVINGVRSIFSDSGITNINFVTTPVPGAVEVYFANFDPSLDILGYALGGVDRFNKSSGEKIIVYGTTAILDSETIAHEVGHALGLVHVKPPIVEQNGVLYKEVMDSEFVTDTVPRFLNSVSDYESPSPLVSFHTHNPLFHLRRYVSGETTESLVSQNVLPGSWDLGLTDVIQYSLNFEDSARLLYRVSLLRGDGNPETTRELAFFSEITLGDLERLLLELSDTDLLSMVGATNATGPLDVILSSGNQFSPTGHLIVPRDAGALGLYQIDMNGTQMILLSQVTVNRVPISSSIWLVSLGLLIMLFASTGRRFQRPGRIRYGCLA